MHEVIIYYIMFRTSTGLITLFFALHGASVCTDRWCARRPQPRAVAMPLVMAYVAGTTFWLFFPVLYGGGMDDHYIAEMNLLLSYVTDAGARREAAPCRLG
jgi:dolichyl-phosphate-mannose--protein O-mannosyl transferase